MPQIGRTNRQAARLRRDQTDVERTVWHALRNRQLAGAKFRRQATVGSYVVDFLCIEARLVVELDGGQHSEAAERRRTSFLEARGDRVLRFWNNEGTEYLEGVLLTIEAALQKQEPSPNPLPQAEEG